jgi:hypothetical protein
VVKPAHHGEGQSGPLSHRIHAAAHRRRGRAKGGAAQATAT